ncbi:putative quinol monooxygenase [Streptomyces sp. GbtcB6]|uniref:putative quinol monooxygenase n=1 Tax=Streptomyces sp. GbtcB6 TaxID=2824751 RepID=UPI001C30B415|nr:antibiotic biosynthesis monooxygenase [Streptomyces sp. GbtcB6]
MPIVIARVRPLPGHVEDVLDAYAETVPLIHQEQGCELFAVHTDGESVFIVERWTRPEDLKAHATSPVMARIRELLADAVAAPADIWQVDNVALGETAKGTIR